MQMSTYLSLYVHVTLFKTYFVLKYNYIFILTDLFFNIKNKNQLNTIHKLLLFIWFEVL